MRIVDIPFVKHIGITKKDEATLKLEPSTNVENHIQTIHASAQFALAETQSGLYLQELFPEFVDKVMPLLRSSNVKYKHPATTQIVAFAHVEDQMKEKFEVQFLRKGCANITVSVELRDSEGVVTMVGEFVWFVQKLYVS